MFQGFVYWSDAVTQSICRASKHNGRNLTVLLSNAGSPRGVAIIQSALQPKGTMNRMHAPHTLTLHSVKEGRLDGASVWSAGTSACSHSGRVCRHQCIVDLLSDSPEFRCVPPETGPKTPEERPAITVPASTSSDPSLAGILSVICE